MPMHTRLELVDLVILKTLVVLVDARLGPDQAGDLTLAMKKETNFILFWKIEMVSHRKERDDESDADEPHNRGEGG